MFTGIIEAVGEICDLTQTRDGARMTIAAGGLALGEVAVGDSLAVNGVCLTVAQLTNSAFSVDLSPETLRCTASFIPGQRVNLEQALKLSDRLGGHLVTGHVDGVAEVIGVAPVGENRVVSLRAPRALSKYLARKGSVAVNGVSLTVNDIEGETFSLNLIPHTLKATNLKELDPGARVNIEVDLLARYLEALLARASMT